MNSLNGTIGFSGMLNGNEIEVVYSDSRYFTITCDGEEFKTSFILTDTGIQFYKPIEIGGTELYRFTWSIANGGSLTAENGGLVLMVAYDPLYLNYEDYLGEYTMSYYFDKNNPNVEQDVTVEALEEGKSYLIKGFSPNFDVVMTYNKKTGRAYLNSQYVATVGARDIWICGWDSAKGQLTWSTGVGMMLEWNGAEQVEKFNFKDYGSWNGYVLNGWYYYSFDAGTMNNGGWFSEWGSNYFCSVLKSLIKK